MAWTGDPVWLADVLRAEGLKVIEHDGWRDRGHGDFLDIRGVICHHTAGGGPNDWKIVQYGRSDLPGPLAQLVLERDGTFRIVAVGVCWHAGRGSHPGWPTNNANFHTIGIEAVNNGTGQDWPAVQLDAYKRGVAAILRKIGRGANDCVAHREYSSEGKIDPFGIDMDAFRRDVAHLIANPSGAKPVTDTEILRDLRAQLTGSADPGKYPGWKQLGGRTVVDALALIGEKLGIEGFKAP
ncbi:N-acetylmuramoyl-L-alanine amidase [Rhodococcus sp. CSLK01-03]|uniref:N-acetylmuramoyl-L-alanine amidase n=1 Tax=Rhodococcus indonesiensis TaxID=3055869 RepID=A0ABT7RM44_9NOCA|nr:N-acetylmuramoyl-L-alanine amidase [Rhodococcus indonesiensis]MDM7488702.1 N-acetylmuramoyl-L-alanine amidase [Rhodococcus indonesiensis]